MDVCPGNSLLTINKSTNFPRESKVLIWTSGISWIVSMEKKIITSSTRCAQTRATLYMSSKLYIAIDIKTALLLRTMFFFIKLFGMILLLLLMEYLSSSYFYCEQLGCGFCVSFLQYLALDIWLQSTAPEILSTLARCIVFWGNVFVVILFFFSNFHGRSFTAFVPLLSQLDTHCFFLVVLLPVQYLQLSL